MDLDKMKLFLMKQEVRARVLVNLMKNDTSLVINKAVIE